MRHKGFTLFYALVVVGVIALMAFGVSRTALNEVVFSSLGRKSQQAFFAANSGLECALYWDLKFAQFLPSAVSSPPADVSLYCAGQDVRTNNFTSINMNSGTTRVITFDVDFFNGTCASVEITKDFDSGTGAIDTAIKSNGEDTCDSGVRSVERTIQVTY